jgi:hypothetical protein
MSSLGPVVEIASTMPTPGALELIGCADTEHLDRVLCGARRVLLAVGVSDLRRRFQDVTRQRRYLG